MGILWYNIIWHSWNIHELVGDENTYQGPQNGGAQHEGDGITRCSGFPDPAEFWACHVDWKQPKVTMPWDQREVSHSSEPELWVWSGILEWDTYKHPISPRVQTFQTFGILESTTRCWELALFEIPPSAAKVATADKPPALLASVLAGMLNQTINGQTFCTSFLDVLYIYD